MSYYVRYESDGTVYNDDYLNDDVLDEVTYKLDEILPADAVSYNDVTFTDEVITIDGLYEDVGSLSSLDEELLGIDYFPKKSYIITISR